MRIPLFVVSLLHNAGKLPSKVSTNLGASHRTIKPWDQTPRPNLRDHLWREKIMIRTSNSPRWENPPLSVPASNQARSIVQKTVPWQGLPVLQEMLISKPSGENSTWHKLITIG
jgi:hypothetical protein